MKMFKLAEFVSINEPFCFWKSYLMHTRVFYEYGSLLGGLYMTLFHLYSAAGDGSCLLTTAVNVLAKFISSWFLHFKPSYKTSYFEKYHF